MLEQFWDKNRVIADMRFYITADLRFASYYADNYGKKRLFKIDFDAVEYVQISFYGSVLHSQLLLPIIKFKLIRI